MLIERSRIEFSKSKSRHIGSHVDGGTELCAARNADVCRAEQPAIETSSWTGSESVRPSVNSQVEAAEHGEDKASVIGPAGRLDGGAADSGNAGVEARQKRDERMHRRNSDGYF